MIVRIPKDNLDLVEEPSPVEVDSTLQGTDNLHDRYLLEEEPDDIDDIYRHPNSGGVFDLVDGHRDMHAGLAEEVSVNKDPFGFGALKFDDEQTS